MSWAASAEPISLESLNKAAALQTRTDRKYILSPAQAQLLLPQISAGAQILQIGSQRTFNYSSVYFDTPELASYHLAAHPRRRRFKIRTRSYLDSGLCFLEVKTEGAREQTVKERIEHPIGQRAVLGEEACAYVRETLDHELGGCPIEVRQLYPVLESAYGRTTLYRADSNSRVTVDEQLSWRDPVSGHALECQQVILETKSALNAGPVDKLLWRHGVRPSRISKFATGLSLLNEHLPANRWHRTKKHKLTTEATLKN